jgi:Protein of unknown function (DUF1156)
VNTPVTPFSLKDAPALIEHLLPVQKLSAEAYKEQMAVQSKTLTALGSYWKGRKPLILNRVLEAVGEDTKMADHFSLIFRPPFPLQRSSQNGPRRQGFASPRPTTARP